MAAIQVAVDDLEIDRTNLVGCAENIERAFLEDFGQAM